MKQEQATLATLGMQSLIPGLETAVNTLQAELERIKAALAFARNGDQSTALADIEPPAQKRPRIARPSPPGDRPRTADGEPPAGWMTTLAAAERLGMHIGALRSLIKNHGWKTRQDPAVRDPGNHRLVNLVRVTDVSREMARRKGAKRHGPGRPPALNRVRPTPGARERLAVRSADGWLSKAAVAEELGIGVSTVEGLQRAKKLRFRYGPHPEGKKGLRFTFYNPEDIAQLKQARAAA